MEFKEAEITTLKNQVQHDAGTGTAPAKVNEKIGEKSKVTTAASSMAELTFADTSITRLGANSLFSFQSKERLIKLEQGSVLVNTPPGNGGATVDCGGVTGAVSGTTFMASRDVSGNVMFLMLEGAGTLKVTINTPTGPVSREIRPGQAATVGSGALKAVAGGDTAPGGGADAKNPENTSGGGEGGEKPAKPEPSIQIFDVDVKKIVETAPLIKEFKNELPSMEKIEKTIEKQQTAVREGKMEKMEVEVVAVKEDGDVLVGAPKVDPDDMKVVNRKDAPDAGLDIDTAAGPDAGAASPKPGPSTVAASPPPAPTPAINNPSLNPGQIADQGAPISRVALTIQANNVSRDFGQDNPAFGFAITSGSLLSGHSLVVDFLVTAGSDSPVGGSPYPVNIANIQARDGSGADVTNRYNIKIVDGVLEVLKAAQNLVFGPVGSLSFGNSVALVASGMGGEITYEVVRGPAQIEDGRLVATSGTGNVVVRARTSGNENYLGASVEQTVSLLKAGQTVSFTLPANLTYDATTGLAATVTGAGNVTFELVNPADASKVSISGSSLKALSGTGTVQIRAVTTGDANFDVASAVQTLTLAKAAQNLNFTGAALTPRAAGSNFIVSVAGVQVGTAGLSILETDGRASLDASGKVTVAKILGINSLTLRAVVGGNDNYLPGQKDLSVAINRDMGAMEAANAIRQMPEVPNMPAKALAALDEYFFFESRAAGYTQGPSTFFSSRPATLNLLNLGHTASSAAVDLGIAWTTLERSQGEAFDFYAGGELDSFSTYNSLVTGTLINPTSNGAPTLLDLAQTTRAFFANSAKIGGALDLNGSVRKFGEGGWFSANGALDLALGTSSPANSEMGLWDDFAGDPPSLTFNAWRTWNDEDGFLDRIANLKLAGTTTLGYTPGLVVATGTDGNPATIDLDLQGLSLDASGAQLEFLSAGSARVRAARFHNLQPSMGMAGAWDWSDPQIEQKAAFRLSAAEKVTMGVTPASPTSPVNEDLADRQQVRIEAIDTSSGTAPTAPASLAVIRSGQSLELRNVVIRNFAGAKLEGEAGRVLVSGSTVRDFKIKELAGLAVNTDAKIQMAVVDAGGRVAGTMQVAGGLPVDKVATGINHSVAVAEVAGVLERQMEEIKLDAKEVNLAADKIHIGSEALRTQISAQNLISLRANTVVLQNSFMSVVQNAGMINIYVRGVGDRLVNPTYGVVAQDLLNFKGINTFKVGSLSFDVHDQVSLDAARGTHIIEASGSTLPQSGKVNVLRM